MAAPIFTAFSKEPDEIVAVCLGTRTTKAVHLRRQAGAFTLLDYVLLETPRTEKGLTKDALTEHFRNVRAALGAETKRAVLVIGMGESLLRNVDLPALPPADLRRMLKNNTLRLLNQELPDFIFDCGVRKPGNEPGSPARPSPSGNAKTLVAGAKQKFVDDLQAAAEEVGWAVEQITLSQIGLASAARSAMPELMQREAVAMVDLGFITTTISILVEGEPLLTRVVAIGADKFTSGLAQALSVGYPAAEGVKVAMPEKVQDKLQAVISPLGRELRAAIDFFEDQEARTVTTVFLTGGSARSDFIVETLQADLGTPCTRWNPTSFLALELPPQKRKDLELDATQLAAAIGAAVTCLDPKLSRINFLAEQIEAALARRHDPVRRGFKLAAALLALMLAWAGVVWYQLRAKYAELGRRTAEYQALAKGDTKAAAFSKAAAKVEAMIANLELQSTNRFLWAQPLAALPQAMVDNIQVVRVSVEQTIVNPEATTEGDASVPSKPANSTEKTTLTIQAKNYGNPSNVDKFIEAVGAVPHFQTKLRKVNGISLKNSLPPQLDPVDPTISFTIFTIECDYAERVLGHD